MENTNPQRTCKELVQEKNKDKQPKAPKSVEINERVMRIEKSNEQGGYEEMNADEIGTENHEC